MRLIAYRDGSLAIMARLDADDTLAPIGPATEFWSAPDPTTAATEAAAGSRRLSEVRQLPPVPPDVKVLCAGLNYAPHAEEANLPLPEVPDLFGRWASTLTVTGHPVPVPPREDHLDWEGELAVIVGRQLRDVTADDAAAGFFGYTCFNDLSARGFQMASPRWTLGKNADLSGPIGPWIVTADEIDDPDGLRIVTRVNGEVVQDGNTADLIFTPAQIAAYASGCLTLRPGDVIVTGTPQGVGFTREPPRFLHPGDCAEVEIERIGRLSTPITEPLR